MSDREPCPVLGCGASAKEGKSVPHVSGCPLVRMLCGHVRADWVPEYKEAVYDDTDKPDIESIPGYCKSCKLVREATVVALEAAARIAENLEVMHGDHYASYNARSCDGPTISKAIRDLALAPDLAATRAELVRKAKAAERLKVMAELSKEKS